MQKQPDTDYFFCKGLRELCLSAPWWNPPHQGHQLFALHDSKPRVKERKAACNQLGATRNAAQVGSYGPFKKRCITLPEQQNRRDQCYLSCSLNSRLGKAAGGRAEWLRARQHWLTVLLWQMLQPLRQWGWSLLEVTGEQPGSAAAGKASQNQGGLGSTAVSDVQQNPFPTQCLLVNLFTSLFLYFALFPKENCTLLPLPTSPR